LYPETPHRTLAWKETTMPRNLATLALACVLALALAGCGGQDTDQATETVEVTIPGFLASPDKYVGQAIALTGTVDHVCKHGGKRMFIMGDDPAQRVKIESGAEISAFDRMLEGSRVHVTGVVRVQEMDRAYLDSWEAEVEAAGDDHAEPEGEDHDHDHAADEHHSSELRQIANYRQQLQESGEESLRFYHLDCLSYEEI
jgi:hypothetical protein